MYIDIEPNDNLAEACMATFNATGATSLIHAARLHLDDGWCWCAVTGWAEGGAIPAGRCAIEESGDGPAVLIHGGAQGLRLARIPGPESVASVRWALDDPEQWAEGFLIVTPEAELR